MSYDSTRDAEQLRMIDPSIDDFIHRYNNSSGPGNGQRQTVILFPGGLASTLKRATQPYLDSTTTAQMFAYDTVWLTWEDFVGGALDLQITKANGKYRDKDDRIIIADGTVDILGWTFYDGFTDWCTKKGLDYFVFGWDWRRRIQDSGRFFVHTFLSHFQERVKDGCNNADPLTNFSLIGHSAGGMVVNWILRKSPGSPIAANLRSAITVATPFYGYSGQLHRWFEGDPDFNWLSKTKLIRTICSLPACYAWQFLDEQTFDENEAAFNADVTYPLTAYPSRDKTTNAVADPYHPLMNGDRGRYRTDTGFDTQELNQAGKLVRYLSSDLAPTLAAKFFNIRGDTNANDTIGGTTWDWVPPTDPTPIADVSSVPGDGVQPAWSARHLGLVDFLPPHVITVKGTDVAHMVTMNSKKTLDALGGVLGV
jgi:pimeloyl-ACP methyl ester carboxylesterase